MKNKKSVRKLPVRIETIRALTAQQLEALVIGGRVPQNTPLCASGGTC